MKEKIISQNITDTLELNYMPYAMSVIVSRAIPEIDGLKPAHRKLLYTMYKMGLLTADRSKSSRVVGETMKLNPHGDGPIYETLVRLTEANGTLLHPLIDSKGSFGKHYSRDMAYAAARYTEVKLAAICQEIFRDIDKNTVDFIDNFDGSMKEPVLLPTTFPNVVVNPNQGIAVGMASNICSFNLIEICNATIAYLNHEEDFLRHVKGPDFSTGAQLIYNQKELDTIYKTGRGNFKMRGKYRYDEKNNLIEIYEIPYSTSVEAIMEKIITLVKNGKIREINDIRDETDLSGLKLTIDIKRNTKVDVLMQKLYNMTPLQDIFSCNFNILIHGHPKTLGLGDILKEWILFRIDSVKKMTLYDIEKASKKQHLLEGLEKILLDIDKAIDIIRKTAEEAQVIPNLMKGFAIDQEQAEYVAEIKLRNLNKEYILKRTSELNDLVKEIERLKELSESDKKIRQYIAKQLKEVAKKYGKERQTDIIYDIEDIEISEEDFVEDYSVKLFLTDHNYFKKVPLLSYKKQTEQKLKDDDKVVQELDGTNKAELLFFSDKANVYKAKAKDLPDTKTSNLGEYLNNLLQMDTDEKILHIVSTTNYEGYMIFAFENGKVAKVNLSSYATKVNRKKLINGYATRSPVVFMTSILEDIDLFLIRSDEKAALINTATILAKASKNASGIQVYSLKKNSKLSHVCRAENFDSQEIDYYRTSKIPTTGHFITEQDKKKNNMPGQIQLFEE